MSAVFSAGEDDARGHQLPRSLGLTASSSIVIDGPAAGGMNPKTPRPQDTHVAISLRCTPHAPVPWHGHFTVQHMVSFLVEHSPLIVLITQWTDARQCSGVGTQSITSTLDPSWYVLGGPGEVELP
mmetsp:Transcript_105004/g.177374  ORF Transcript_105004/g.177374 Transcript_105004/m.177374 type:complete len:126 (+) Transcript_105004:155-532(+)